jgi:hypothetical protein
MAEATETPKQTIDRLTVELTAANQLIAEYQAQQKQASADEIEIRSKMILGLTREQAFGVIKRQREHDLAVKAAAAAVKK